MLDFAQPSLRAVAAALAAREVSAREVIDEVCRNHERFGERVNAYVAWLGNEAATEAARTPLAGRLSGVPVSVKDCIGLAGLPTYAGSKRRLPADWQREGPVVQMIRRQGGVFVGKTFQTEFALGATGINPYGPQPRNPWDARHVRSAGGSSTGAGLSLVEGSALLALGTDTLGSVRLPASVTGTVGLKPSGGRWSVDGVVPLSPTLDSLGLLTRSVADAAYAFAAIDPTWQGCDDFLERIGSLSSATPRISVPDAAWDHGEPSIIETCKRALDGIVKGGASLSSIALPEAAEAFQFVQEGSVAVAEFDAFLESSLPEWRALLLPGTAALAERGSRATARQYLLDLRHLRAMAARAAERFRETDVLAWPTVPLSPPVLARLDSDMERRRYHLGMLRNTCISSCLHLCAITIPVGLDAEGMPVGLEFAAPAGKEERLLAVALAAERQIGPAWERIGNPPLLAAGLVPR